MISFVKEHYRVDRLIRTQKVKDSFLHGRDYGMRRRYYHCERCNIAFGTMVPFYIAYSFINGLNYAIPRPIQGVMPACPGCRSRDSIKVVRKYKRKDDKNVKEM